jgi:hypothetical protein
MKMAVFWVVGPCSVVEVHRRFRGACCLHNQGPDDYTAQQPRRLSSSSLEFFDIFWWNTYHFHEVSVIILYEFE